MKDLLKFPQLPVTSYTLSSLYLATVSPNHLLYSLASSNERLTKVSTITSLDSCRLDHLSLCSSEECPTYHNFHNYQFQVQLSQCFFHIANGQTVKIIITKLPSYRVTKLNFISMLPALPLLNLREGISDFQWHLLYVKVWDRASVWQCKYARLQVYDNGSKRQCKTASIRHCKCVTV